MNSLARVIALPLAPATSSPEVPVQKTSGVPPQITPPQERRRRKQVWLALHFADWSLHAALQTMSLQQRTNLMQQPLAVLDQDRQCHVLAANHAALAQGIRPGHTLNAALALCAQLQLLSRDLTAEQKSLDALAAWAQRFTPMVNIEAPNELLLEVRGSLRLFGGSVMLLQQIEQALQQQQLVASMALSPTPRASLCMARAQCIRRGNAVQVVTPMQLKAALAILPLTCLHWPQAIEARLKRFGVTRLGELWRLPRADLARRIGVQYLRELDALLGRHVELRPTFNVAPTYRDRLLLDFEISSISLLEQVLLAALDRLQHYLREHDLSLTRVYIDLKHREQDSTRVAIGVATPTAEMPRVAALLHERLNALTLSAPVLEITLRVKQLLAAQGQVVDMLAGITHHRPAQSQLSMLGRLLERLQVRLGNDAIQALCWHADHRPEYAQCKQSATLRSETSMQKQFPVQVSRPLWLLSEPQSLSIDGKPPDDLKLLQGPERIEAGWWNGKPVKRDYYVAKTRNQSCCWVFKNLMPPAGWFVHGWFG